MRTCIVCGHLLPAGKREYCTEACRIAMYGGTQGIATRKHVEATAPPPPALQRHEIIHRANRLVIGDKPLEFYYRGTGFAVTRSQCEYGVATLYEVRAIRLRQKHKNYGVEVMRVIDELTQEQAA